MADKKNIQDIKEGEFVMLASGTVSMTVIGITYNQEGQITHLECAWQDSFPSGHQAINVKKIPATALEVYRSPYDAIPDDYVLPRFRNT